jgi:hypothetical protein
LLLAAALAAWFISGELSRCMEDQLRWSGGALQLLGVVTVWVELEYRWRSAGLGSQLRMGWSWLLSWGRRLLRLLPFQRKSDLFVDGGGAELLVISDRSEAGLAPNLEQRLGKLERSASVLEAQLKNEKRLRQRDVQRLERLVDRAIQLHKDAVASTVRETHNVLSLGASLIFSGVIMTTWNKEIAALL